MMLLGITDRDGEIQIKRKDKFAYIVKQTPETAVKMRQLPTILLKNYILSSGGIKSIMVSKEKSTGGQNVVDHGFFRKTFLYYYIKLELGQSLS